VPIEAELLSVIEDYLDSWAGRLPAILKSSPGKGLSRWAANAPLFVGRDGGRITRGTIQSRVRRAFRRAGPDAQPVRAGHGGTRGKGVWWHTGEARPADRHPGRPGSPRSGCAGKWIGPPQPPCTPTVPTCPRSA
jgi:hypothetical protein